jgi:hypothetical protein
VGDDRRAELRLVELCQHGGDLRLDDVVGRPREDHGDPRPGGDRIVEVGVGEEHQAQLADAQDEPEQGGGDERELDGAGAFLVASEVALQHHWTLSAPVAVICRDFMKNDPTKVFTTLRWT